MRVTLFCKEDAYSQQVGKDFRNLLKERHHQIDDDSPEYVICIGGDGTFLRAVHRYLKEIDKVKFVGIHTGTLGFFCDYEPENVLTLIEDLEEKTIQAKPYRLLEAKITFQNHVETIYGVNEIRLENPFHTLICDVYIDEYFLETYRGNGLSVCGPLGSTGYNKSLGGAAVESLVDVLQLTEIAPISSNVFRSLGSSLILDTRRRITLEGKFPEAIIGYDHLTLPDRGPKKIEIYQSDKSIQLFHQNRHPYVKTLREAFIVDGD
ncbi:MAG: NAD kinase [Bacilli bacterium]|jgi:NAD+ kinase